ncbi:hypothetical protein [Cellulosimicrobium sp. I38E]|uniref:hypothetical protein n=1 Tax=Cellulosimicrobium sp. I38E TaxID=1393139 RepID=UPI0007B180D5|nr:hypothetical protein [Cellulosimicrobium sp. I38E]KZM78394.1 hypothetical protein A0J59_13775 [Cellulosimicrobium sp. I38E]
MAITNFKPTIWHAALLENLHAAQVVVPTLNTEYEGDIANGGETVRITSVVQPTIKTYAGSIVRDNLTDTSQDLDIDQKKYYAYLVDDVDAVQAAGSFDSVQTDAAAGLADVAENYLITEMLADGTAGGGTTAVTDFAGAFGIVSTLRKALTKAKIPTADRFIVANPEFISLLLGPGSSLVKVNEAGADGELRNGVVGRLLGFTVLESPATALANTDKPAAIGYHGRSVAYADQIVKTRAQTVTDAFGDQVDGLHVYGGKVLRPTAVQTYVSA